MTPGHHAALDEAKPLQRPDDPGDGDERARDREKDPPHVIGPLC